MMKHYANKNSLCFYRHFCQFSPLSCSILQVPRVKIIFFSSQFLKAFANLTNFQTLFQTNKIFRLCPPTEKGIRLSFSLFALNVSQPFSEVKQMYSIVSNQTSPSTGHISLNAFLRNAEI